MRLHLLSYIVYLVPIIAFAIIGVVMGPRAGAARGRMWLGLGLLIASTVVSLIWQATIFGLVSRVSASGIGMIGSVANLAGTALTIAGVAVLCSAVAMARDVTSGYGPPSRPGGPPTTYQNPGSNPYV